MTNLRFDVYRELNDLAYQFCSGDKALLENVLLVGMQHILETTVDMLAVMKEYGLRYAVIGGKKYSTHAESAKKIENLGFTYVEDGCQLGYGRFDDCMQEVVHKIWFHALEKIKTKKFDLIIILDDGADLLRATPGYLFHGTSSRHFKNKPEMIIGIEQTRGGTNHPLFSGLPFPVIDVAGSFIKAKTEYPKVAEIIASRVTELINEQMGKELEFLTVIGVLGYGTMGKAIAKHFVEKGFTVIAHDKDKTKRDQFLEVIHYDNPSVMIANADVVIGCTGKDVTLKKANLDAFLYSRQKKWLISTGSKDHEFNHLLRVIQNEVKGLGYVPDPLRTIFYENYVGGVLEIVRGGFPINFTNEAHSVMPEYIWPTRAALMLACFSAVYMKKNHFKHYKNINVFTLPIEAQSAILKKYCELNPNETELTELCQKNKQDLYKCIAENSDGLRLFIENKDSIEIFS